MSDAAQATDCPLCRHGLPCAENERLLRSRLAATEAALEEAKQATSDAEYRRQRSDDALDETARQRDAADAALAAERQAHEETKRDRDNWIESARSFAKNEAYYRDMIDAALADVPEAYVADDGSTVGDVLRAKLPDLFAKEKDFRRAAESALASERASHEETKRDADHWRTSSDDYRRLLSVAEGHEKAERARAEGLETAATALVRKMDEVDNSPEYMGVWGLFWTHGYEYEGPKYETELNAMKATLWPELAEVLTRPDAGATTGDGTEVKP